MQKKLINNIKDSILKYGFALKNMQAGVSVYPEDAITSDELIEQAEKSEIYLN